MHADQTANPESPNADDHEQLAKSAEARVITHLKACERIRRASELSQETMLLISNLLQQEEAHGERKAVAMKEVMNLLPLVAQRFRESEAGYGATGDHMRGNAGAGQPPSPMAQPIVPSSHDVMGHGYAPLRVFSDKPIKQSNAYTAPPTPVIARPQSGPLRVEQIEILGNPAHWAIADILVGTESQFPNSGPPIPGQCFTPGGTCHQFVTRAIQTAMDFTILVHYLGDQPEGEVFVAVANGALAR